MAVFRADKQRGGFRWAPTDVRDRLEEAAETLRRLPGGSRAVVGRLKALWPDTPSDWSEYGWRIRGDAM